MSGITQVLVAALGVAMSPVPVVAVLIILLTKRARLGSLVFAVAWVAGNATAIIIAINFADSLGVPRNGLDFPAEGGLTVLLGIGLVVTAWLSRRARHQAQAPADTPRWVASVDNLSPSGGAFVAFTNATTSPKNLALAISAGVAITGSGAKGADQALAALLYVGVASLTVVIPVVVYFVAGERATPVISRWKRNVTARAAVIMEVMLLVVGLALSARGISNLLG